MNYVNKTWKLFDNYVLSKYQNRPSTAQFWYLPEPSNITSQKDLLTYHANGIPAFYFINYSHKLIYPLEGKDGIILLPYNNPIGNQINPEAAFQYALGLHDQYMRLKKSCTFTKFWHYVDYFITNQTSDGLWPYQFDWYGSKSPWYSALAQSRGASVMLRAWLHRKDSCYLEAAKKALVKFMVPIQQEGFLHYFKEENCAYFEEYPYMPTGVINGFMASLFGIWELRHFAEEQWLDEMWHLGIRSLKTMLPYYSNGWWSLYDLDHNSPLLNVNSPRYHRLEIDYLQILAVLSGDEMLFHEAERRTAQYSKIGSRLKATFLKSVRKIIYK